MPKPSGAEIVDTTKHLFVHELNYNRKGYAAEAFKMKKLFTYERSNEFNEIIAVVKSGKCEFFFLYSFGDTGMTFP